MAGARSHGSFRRYFLYLVAAIPIAAVIFALATAAGSAPAAKVAFDVKVEISGQEVRASGTTYLTSDGFDFAGGRVQFAGKVSGDDVSVDGKVTNDDRTQTRDFRASGHLNGERLSLTLNGDGGRRMGTMKLELINR
jgi:hypothetical protein